MKKLCGILLCIILALICWVQSQHFAEKTKILPQETKRLSRESDFFWNDEQVDIKVAFIKKGDRL